MKRLVPVLLASLVVVWGCQSGGGETAKTDGTPTPPADGGKVTFAMANAVIKENCVSCHGGGTGAPADGVNLTTMEWTTRIVKPGDPEGSEIIHLMKGTKGKTMPPKNPLPAEKVKIIEDWIKAGASTN